MRFVPYVYAKDSVRLPVVVKSMTAADAQRTNQPPLWQTSLTSDYLSDDRLESYAVQFAEDYGAVRLPAFSSAAPRFLIADSAAKAIFFSYLEA